LILEWNYFNFIKKLVINFCHNGDQVRLIVQLIQPGREGHAWAREYDREWKDILFVQSEVAQTVAKE